MMTSTRQASDVQTISSVSAKVLGNLIDRLGEDHLRQARNWHYHDQRADFIRHVLRRYWSGEELNALFPAKVHSVTAQLETLLAQAEAACHGRTNH